MNEAGNVETGLIGLILLWSGIFKVASPEARKAIHESAVSVLIPRPTMAYVAYKLIGIIELTVGLLLIIPPMIWYENVITIFLGVGFIAYLWIARKMAPDHSCGCMGHHGKSISWRTILRAVYFLSLSIIAWKFEGANWTQTMMRNPYLIGALLLEISVFISLSSESDWIWAKLGIRKGLYRNLRNKLACAATRISYQEIVERLHQSMVYQAYHQVIATGKLADSWRDGCLYFVSYDAKYLGQDTSIVFAIPIGSSENLRRAVIVDRDRNAVFLSYDPMDLETLRVAL